MFGKLIIGRNFSFKINIFDNIIIITIIIQDINSNEALNWTGRIRKAFK